MFAQRFLTTEEVASLMRVDPSTIRRWRLDGVGPGFVKVGSVYRYPEASLQEWISERVERRRAS